MMTRSQYQFTLQDPDTDELYRVAPRLRGRAARRSTASRTSPPTCRSRNPQVTVDLEPRPDRGARPDRGPGRAGADVAYGSRQVSQIFAPDDQYQVILQVDPRYQRDPAALSMLYVRRAGGKLVPLSTRRRRRARPSGPLSVNHTGQLPSVTLSFNLRPASRSATPWPACRRSARETLPATVIGQLPGHGAGVPGLDDRPRVGARARDLRDLHRARHPLRELHPPDHDPLGPARRPASARC